MPQSVLFSVDITVTNKQEFPLLPLYLLHFKHWDTKLCGVLLFLFMAASCAVIFKMQEKSLSG